MSCTLSWSENKTEAWCSTKVDESGEHISGHEGFCEPACQPEKLTEDTNVESEIIGKGLFKYYVIMFLTFLGPPTYLFDDTQYCKSSKIAIF